MKFKIEKKDIVMVPESDMDLYNIGVLHNQYGGLIHCNRETNEKPKITEYSIDSHVVVDFLILHAGDNGK